MTGMKKLEAWLDGHNAVRLWQVRHESGAWVDGYRIGVNVVIVQRFAMMRGWELFVQACPGNNSVEDTLAAADAVLTRPC